MQGAATEVIATAGLGCLLSIPGTALAMGSRGAAHTSQQPPPNTLPGRPPWQTALAAHGRGKAVCVRSADRRMEGPPTAGQDAARHTWGSQTRRTQTLAAAAVSSGRCCGCARTARPAAAMSGRLPRFCLLIACMERGSRLLASTAGLTAPGMLPRDQRAPCRIGPRFPVPARRQAGFLRAKQSGWCRMLEALHRHGCKLSTPQGAPTKHMQPRDILHLVTSNCALAFAPSTPGMVQRQPTPTRLPLTPGWLHPCGCWCLGLSKRTGLYLLDQSHFPEHSVCRVSWSRGANTCTQ